jgi:hypothetical protein
VVSLTPRPLYPRGESTRCPLHERLGGPQSRSGHGAEENSDPLQGIEPRSSNRPARGLVTIPTEISRLQEEFIFTNYRVCLLLNRSFALTVPGLSSIPTKDS